MPITIRITEIKIIIIVIIITVIINNNKNNGRSNSSKHVKISQPLLFFPAVYILVCHTTIGEQVQRFAFLLNCHHYYY